MKTINNELIRSFSPCYDPSEYVTDENETLPILEWVEKYRTVVPDEDITWLLCHKEFMSDKDLRLFAVWCARKALSLIDNPDPRNIEACNVAERYANGEATDEELEAARARAADVANDPAAYTAADPAADPTAYPAAYTAAYWATYSAAARAARVVAYFAARVVATSTDQLDKLLTYFNS